MTMVGLPTQVQEIQRGPKPKTPTQRYRDAERRRAKLEEALRQKQDKVAMRQKQERDARKREVQLNAELLELGRLLKNGYGARLRQACTDGAAKWLIEFA